MPFQSYGGAPVLYSFRSVSAPHARVNPSDLDLLYAELVDGWLRLSWGYPQRSI